MALAPSPPPAHATGDLELRLLQSFAAFAAHGVGAAYASAKSSSRLLGFVASTAERVVATTGLLRLAELLFAQYQRLGHPLIEYVDEAMGRRVIKAFVNLLLLAESRQGDEKDLENGSPKLTVEERLHALLQGDVPRLRALLTESRASEAEAQDKAKRAEASVVVMDLQDFVAKDEVKRLQDEARELLAAKEEEVAALKDQVNQVERARQQLEQDLTDVHNYQESERGRRFQEMEEELARTKLEASQKAHDLRKLELVIEAMRRKKTLKTRSRSSVSASSEANDENS